MDPARRPRWQALSGRAGVWALVLAAVALALTFARPTATLSLPQIEAVVVFDVTQSMNVADQILAGQAISRLAFAKARIEQLVPLLPCGSRLGWAIFTDHRSLLLSEPIEVCVHRRELLAELRRLDGSMAWAGNSEVAKGINSGMQMVNSLGGSPALVFVTDGHEAPPISPNYRPAFSLARGKVRGVLVGVGGEVAQPIPKLDPSGRSLGTWQAKDVLQVDPRSLGRAGNGEAMVDSAEAGKAPAVGATPGSEHLSSLREGYLELLASETGLGYHRLSTAQALFSLLADARFSKRADTAADLRPVLGGLALLALLWPAWAAMAALVRARWRTRQRPALASAATRPHK